MLKQFLSVSLDQVIFLFDEFSNVMLDPVSQHCFAHSNIFIFSAKCVKVCLIQTYLKGFC